MNRSYPLVEIHYALWAVLTVPIGFAGMFFLIPGLIFEVGIPLQIIAATLIFYIAKLTQGARAAWLFGLVLHTAHILGAVYYIPRLHALLGWPLLLANLYSLIVLLVYRQLWTQAPAVRRA
ncbi:MAG: hypothetical protein GTO46_09525 [Gemmatimonadetes bacterium]|nr:hypothetical protein [Gemmatimonadota bacterium]NIO31855.1 hypothetical protein [Gemmatimonadota bacterium]